MVPLPSPLRFVLVALAGWVNQQQRDVTPDTLLAWDRRLIAQQYDGSARRGPGRSPFMAEVRALIVRMATENRDWGYTRIQGALANLDHQVGRATIANILREHGLEPAPERVRRPPGRSS
jgi:HTH-like domain